MRSGLPGDVLRLGQPRSVSAEGIGLEWWPGASRGRTQGQADGIFRGGDKEAATSMHVKLPEQVHF